MTDVVLTVTERPVHRISTPLASGWNSNHQQPGGRQTDRTSLFQQMIAADVVIDAVVDTGKAGYGN
jgi:hypothetical protein